MPYLKRWGKIGGYSVVSRGVMPYYVDKQIAFKDWELKKKVYPFRGSAQAQEVVNDTIEKWLKEGVIVNANYEDLRWINPIGVVPKLDGGFRVITDCRGVNNHMKKIHFKMENVATLLELWEKDDHAVSFDLSNAYNHVPVHLSL
jgi:hypothetical protein